MKFKCNHIQTMQNYLSILRKLNAWTAEDVGNRIGLTKQSISNLENFKVSMTKTQYIALRTVFEYEIRYGSNEVLKKAMYILFYSRIDCCNDENKSIKEALENIAAASVGGISGAQQSLMFMTLLAPTKALYGVNVELALNAPPYAWLDDLSLEEIE